MYRTINGWIYVISGAHLCVDFVHFTICSLVNLDWRRNSIGRITVYTLDEGMTLKSAYFIHKKTAPYFYFIIFWLSQYSTMSKALIYSRFKGSAIFMIIKFVVPRLIMYSYLLSKLCHIHTELCFFFLVSLICLYLCLSTARCRDTVAYCSIWVEWSPQVSLKHVHRS